MNSSEIYIKVQPEQLYSKSALIENKVRQTKVKFDEMQRIIASSSYYWEGEAQKAYKKSYSQFKDEIFEIIARLEEHVADLSKMAGVYEQAEEETKQMAESLPTDVII